MAAAVDSEKKIVNSVCFIMFNVQYSTFNVQLLKFEVLFAYEQRLTNDL